MFYIIHTWCNFDGEIFEIVHIVHIVHILNYTCCTFDGEIFEIVHIVHAVNIVNYTWCTFDGEKHRGNFTIWLGPLRRPLETLLICPLNHHHLFLST